VRARKAIYAAATLGFVVMLPADAQAPQEAAQNAADKPEQTAIPRLADGHPNLQGIWHNEVGAAALRKAGPFGDYHSPGVPLPYPYLPITQKIKDYRFTHDLYADPEAHCHLPGVPRETEQPSGIFPFKIIQDEKYIVILFEYTHDVRIIPEDGSPHPSHYAAWDGDSRGHWDGDTFVVDVANFNGRTWLDMDANFVDENEHVVERCTMTGPNSIALAATVEDATVFSRPWTMHLTLKRNPAKEHLVEYDCHEGERDVDHYLQSEGNPSGKHE
jgi:hypothetical protein